MTPWDEVALKKLTRVIGEDEAIQIRARFLRELGVSELSNVDDLSRFANALIERGGGFVAAVGGLLSVHAAIHGASPDPTRA